MIAARCASLCCLLCAAASLQAQIAQSDTAVTSPPVPALSMGFERNVNTFQWDMRGMQTLGGDTWKLSASDRFLRSLIRSERESIKDENTLEIRAAKRISQYLQIVGRMWSFVFSDSKISGLNDISSHSFLGGLEVQPWQSLTLTPLAGYAYDSQQGFLDRGFAYHAAGDLRSLRFGDSELSGQALLSGSSLSPRVQQEHSVNGMLFSAITPNSVNRLQVFYRTMRRDFYLTFDTATMAYTGAARDIESRREQSFGGGDAISYAFDGRLGIDATVDLVQRRIGKSRGIKALSAGAQLFDSNIDEFRLNGSALLRYRGQSTALQLLLELNERSEHYTIERFAGASPVLFSQQERLEEQKNNAITQTHLAFTATQALSRSDTIVVSGSTVKAVYDTPSSLNVDDRDELFLLASARWSHRFNRNLLAYLAGDINVRHTVYISSERSANNTWNRVIRLSPGTEYRLGDRFSTRNSADVIANYTVYDFEESNPSQRSYSLRQLIVTDSSSYAFHRQLTLVLQLQVRISERGEFRWNAFTVRPLAWHDERSMTVSFVHPARWATISAGFRLFELVRYRYSGGDKVKENTLRSYGPVCRIWCGMIGQTSLIADGWYQITSEQPGGTRTTPNLSLSAVWNL
jgi:hypothetical protein